MDFKEIKAKMNNVPFGMSQFQIINFAANFETPERVYRNVLLQIDSKLKAMQECSFRRKRRELDIEEIKEKQKTASGVSAKRLNVDLEESEYYLESEIKLIEDCAIEIATYEKILSTLPDFTREQFEQGEAVYWKERLMLDAKHELRSTGTVGIGTIKSLHQMGIEMGRAEKTGQFVTIENKGLNKIT